MISVVVPALNEEKLLPACLESLRNQDYTGEYELIVADNGSTDSTADIARRFGARVLPCPEKRSVFYARQVGADAARGEIIVQADADTSYPRDWLSRIADHFASHQEAVAVAGRFIYGDPPSWAGLEYLVRRAINRLTAGILGIPLFVSGAALAFRRRAFLAINGYKNIPLAADQIGICARLVKQGKILYDANLFALTSSRRVRKPFLVVFTVDIWAHLTRWGIYFGRVATDMLKRFTGKTPARRMAARLFPALALVIAYSAYGYFIPTSPVFGKVYYKGAASTEVLALTFDDGPNEPYTSQILDILASYNVKATFFVIGKNVELYPETARRIVAEGHVLGNHSYHHNANHALTRYGSIDLELAQEVIFNTVGVRPHLYRPPHGKKSPWELQTIKREGLIEITWSISTNELRARSAAQVAQSIVTKAKPGGIILLHDGYGTLHNSRRSEKSLTVETLPLIIEELQARGYSFATVPELLNMPAYQEPAH